MELEELLDIRKSVFEDTLLEECRLNMAQLCNSVKNIYSSVSDVKLKEMYIDGNSRALDVLYMRGLPAFFEVLENYSYAYGLTQKELDFACDALLDSLNKYIDVPHWRKYRFCSAVKFYLPKALAKYWELEVKGREDVLDLDELLSFEEGTYTTGASLSEDYMYGSKSFDDWFDNFVRSIVAPMRTEDIKQQRLIEISKNFIAAKEDVKTEAVQASEYSVTPARIWQCKRILRRSFEKSLSPNTMKGKELLAFASYANRTSCAHNVNDDEKEKQ